ncbi:DUF3179 domain-containing protein [Jannaschia marina]|uniref:DUF3179 domain-containing protein n=1 Tax=Jannaschia marina TaxID=2741674 RepID=UPI0015CADA8B|nr:DUF3179 domain-containing protein [Jannaschia marina]
MHLTRRQFAAITLATALPHAAGAQTPEASALRDALNYQLWGSEADHRAGLTLIAERGTPDMAAALIRALRFSRSRRGAIAATLETITGQDHGTDWFAWMLWQEVNPQIVPHPVTVQFTRDVLLQIDPEFDVFLRPEYLDPAETRIRFEEVTWGGVRKDGIPSLDNPAMIDAGAADYLRDEDLVFGVSINGDTRAYPLRIMGWHEMFNDVIGGVPVALAYCTLCGSGILFETQVPGFSEPLVFGSSGFLYRSNKLMFDRDSHTLWNQFTGRPVIGPFVGRDIALRQRPVVITTWAKWRAANPGTTVLSLDTGHRRDYGAGVVYADYFASPDLMFPARVDQAIHAQKDYVFAVRTTGAARAWPLGAFAERPVINDAIGATPLVLLGDPESRSARAYERGDRRFETRDGALVSGGETWRLTEDALVAADGTRLPRVAGHIAYWFAWNNYLGDLATVYEG